ncbi:MAG: hypothetical protein M3032_11680 [Verrucomicrobiota bacterium]|nr:hypothetical protein [Verrucomicrobiota bacterium]
MKPREDPAAQANGPSILARLKPNVSVDQANLEAIELARRLAKEYPKTNGQLTSASVQPLLKSFTGPQLRQTVYAML